MNMNIKKVSMISLALATLAGSAYCIGINNHPYVNIHRIKEKKDSLFFNELFISDEEFLSKYDKLKMISLENSFNKETSKYDICLKFENTSQEVLKNLKIDFTLHGSSEMKELEPMVLNKDVKSQDIIEYNFSLDKKDLISLYPQYDIEINEKYSNQFSTYIHQFKMDYSYSYENDISENLSLKNSIDIDGKLLSSEAHIYNELNEDEVKTTHKNNGSYLNMTNPEESNEFNLIDVEHIELKFDKSLNMALTCKMKNKSNTTLSYLHFRPYLSLVSGGVLTPSTIMFDDEDDIQPGEEFEVSISLSKEELLDNVGLDLKYEDKEFEDVEDMFKYLLRNRKVVLSYTYQYEGDSGINTVLTKYSNTSRPYSTMYMLESLNK